MNYDNGGNGSTTSNDTNKPAFYCIEKSKAVAVKTDGIRDKDGVEDDMDTGRNQQQPVV